MNRVNQESQDHLDHQAQSEVMANQDLPEMMDYR